MHKLSFLCDVFGVFDVLVVVATSIDVYVLWLAGMFGSASFTLDSFFT